MSNQINDMHYKLKVALLVRRVGIKEFANTLKKPDGTIGISHQALIRVAQDKEKTPWIRSVIHNTIKETSKDYPNIWEELFKRDWIDAKEFALRTNLKHKTVTNYAGKGTIKMTKKNISGQYLIHTSELENWEK